jgi:TnsA endonuclease N terminal
MRDFAVRIPHGAVITAQPVTIFFVDEGRTRRYTPDFRVDWSIGVSELVEIKYRADLRLNWRNLRPGFEAARIWARERGASFRISTERDIRGLHLDVAKQLPPLRGAPVDIVLAKYALLAVRDGTAATFGELALLPAGRGAAQATVWRLIARGALRVDLSSPIDFSTKVVAP